MVVRSRGTLIRPRWSIVAGRGPRRMAVAGRRQGGAYCTGHAGIAAARRRAAQGWTHLRHRPAPGRLDLRAEEKKVELLIRYYHGQPFKGPNDLTFDDDGNLYFTDAWQTGADDPTGALFMADAASGYRKLTKLIGNLAMPNGVGFAPDGNSFYVAEPEELKLALSARSQQWRLAQLLRIDAFLERQWPGRVEGRREGLRLPGQLQFAGDLRDRSEPRDRRVRAKSRKAASPPTLLSSRARDRSTSRRRNGTMSGASRSTTSG